MLNRILGTPEVLGLLNGYRKKFVDEGHIAMLLHFSVLCHDLRLVVKMKLNSLIVEHLSDWVTETCIWSL